MTSKRRPKVQIALAKLSEIAVPHMGRGIFRETFAGSDGHFWYRFFNKFRSVSVTAFLQGPKRN